MMKSWKFEFIYKTPTGTDTYIHQFSARMPKSAWRKATEYGHKGVPMTWLLVSITALEATLP